LQLAHYGDGASLQQLAAEAGYSKSTVHRLLATLGRLEMVEREPQTRRYRLGRRARDLGRGPSPQRDLRQVTRPYMEDLRARSGETVTLHVVEGCEHVVVDECESTQEIRHTLPIGLRVPLLRGATAKAILAFLAPEARQRALAQTRTEEAPGPSDEELQDIHDLGYALSLAERVPGGAAISAPLRDATGSVCGALSISGPNFRFTSARATRCAPYLVEAAAEVSQAIGYAPAAREWNGRSVRAP
jgi:DNA-binding IclR family transcriptional regulator